VSRDQNVFVLVGFSVVAFIFCFDALRAPFWGDRDLWSNLLPIVHYRQSILVENTFPLYTDLWYGGRYQWMNPLSSFLYLPATIIWLLFPLAWGIRIVMVGHLIFSLYVGWRISNLFLEDYLTRFAAAFLFTSPVFPALYPGHFEKIMAGPWILLGLYYLFDEGRNASKQGLYAGLCLALVALTGANYYVLYAGILFFGIALSRRSFQLIYMMILGTLPGLLHLPSVWHLIGVSRGVNDFPPEINVLDWPEMLVSIGLGLVRPIEWEKLAVLGIPTVYLFCKFVLQYLVKVFRRIRDSQLPAETALLISILAFSLFATGAIYRYYHLFDTFRVQARAVAFVALGVFLFVLLGVRGEAKSNSSKSRLIHFLLLTSIIQVFIIWWWIRPTGTQNSPQLASELSAYLESQNAHSVWFSFTELTEMFIDVDLNIHNIALPNPYYGDMGQIVPISGPYCGYSFDYLLSSQVNDAEKASLLYSNVKIGELLGVIPQEKLFFVRSFKIAEKNYDLYRIVCSSK
jgi:hypothetical protein